MRVQSDKTLPEPRMPFASTVPPTPAEERAGDGRWERRGLLGRLVRQG
jgi:hypothetical protein